MDVARLLHGEVERDDDIVQVRLVRRLKVDRVLQRLGQAYPNVECVLKTVNICGSHSKRNVLILLKVAAYFEMILLCFVVFCLKLYLY